MCDVDRIYCPVCGEWIEASYFEDVEGAEDGIFIHKDIVHTESEAEALMHGVN